MHISLLSALLQVQNKLQSQRPLFFPPLLFSRFLKTLRVLHAKELLPRTKGFDMKPQQKRIKQVVKLCTMKKKITKVSKKKKSAHESCPCVIPNEIFFSQILPRLPFKFLCKLKCVSKEWCHIISYEPYFMLQQSCYISVVPASYIFVNINALCILPTCGRPAGIHDSSLMTILRNNDILYCNSISIVASTNGLLCFLCGMLKICALPNIFHVVCNPVTRESEFISYYLRKGNLHVIGRGFGLAFDPSAIPASYKLVQLLLKRCPSTSKFFGQIAIYSSDTGGWIESKVHVSISSFEKLYGTHSFRKSVFVGGVIFWKLSRCLLYYDIENDAANTLSLPRPDAHSLPRPDAQLNARIYFEEIGQCGGCATLTRITGITLDFWMLLGYYGHNPKWKLMHRVTFKGILEHFNRGCGCLKPLPCNNDEEMIYMHIHDPKEKNELLSYDIKGGKVVSCGSFPVKLKSSFVNWIFSYNNSLVVLPRKEAKNLSLP